MCVFSLCCETGSEGGAGSGSSLLLKHRPGDCCHNTEPCCSSGENESLCLHLNVAPLIVLPLMTSLWLCVTECCRCDGGSGAAAAGPCSCRLPTDSTRLPRPQLSGAAGRSSSATESGTETLEVLGTLGVLYICLTTVLEVYVIYCVCAEFNRN